MTVLTIAYFLGLVFISASKRGAAEFMYGLVVLGMIYIVGGTVIDIRSELARLQPRVEPSAPAQQR